MTSLERRGKIPRPPIAEFKLPVTASTESRIASASRRRRFWRQKRSFPGSIATAAASLAREDMR